VTQTKGVADIPPYYQELREKRIEFRRHLAVKAMFRSRFWDETVAMGSTFHPNQLVVYIAAKRSVHPGPRAKEIRPEPSGEGYRYLVDKYWLVVEVRGETLVLRTRTGKLHEVRSSDPCLRAASWRERLLYRNRFPVSDATPEGFIPSHHA
jgi:hypothetical protein